MSPTETEVVLPITSDEFDSLLDEVVEKFQLPDNDDVEEACATAIMHLPPGKAYVPIAYFGNAAIQQLSKVVAFDRLEHFRKKRAEEAAKKNPPKKENVSEQPVQDAPVQAPVPGVESKT